VGIRLCHDRQLGRTGYGRYDFSDLIKHISSMLREERKSVPVTGKELSSKESAVSHKKHLAT